VPHNYWVIDLSHKEVIDRYLYTLARTAFFIDQTIRAKPDSAASTLFPTTDTLTKVGARATGAAIDTLLGGFTPTNIRRRQRYSPLSKKISSGTFLLQVLIQQVLFHTH
jgi:hypothetical protein